MIQVLAAGTGETLGEPGARDRFMIDAAAADGRFSLVQHLLGPRVLAAPVHRHHAEDEFSYVLSGRIGVAIGDDEVVAEQGDLVFKPRNQWRTFARRAGGAVPRARPDDRVPRPGEAHRDAAVYRCDVDFAATTPIVDRHGLVF